MLVDGLLDTLLGLTLDTGTPSNTTGEHQYSRAIWMSVIWIIPKVQSIFPPFFAQCNL